MAYLYNSIVWSVIAALLGDENSVKSPLEDEKQIETQFIRDHDSQNIAWDPQYEWSHNQYAEACVLNDIAAFKYSLANQDQLKQTHCRSTVYYQGDFDCKTAPRATILLNKGQDSKILRTNVVQCSCQTYAAPNGVRNKNLLLINSTFSIVKKKEGHNYYHLRYILGRGKFELDSYYEFDPTYAEKHIKLEKVEDEEN